MASVSIVIPVFRIDDSLNICLLSILGNVASNKLNVVLVPCSLTAEQIVNLRIWQKRSEHVIITDMADNMIDAVKYGVNASSCLYVMFMVQCDKLVSHSGLYKAITLAEKLNVSVMLFPNRREYAEDGLLKTEVKTFHPSRFKTKTYCKICDDEQSIFAIIPSIFGNVYCREYLECLMDNRQYESQDCNLVLFLDALHDSACVFYNKSLVISRYLGYVNARSCNHSIQRLELSLNSILEKSFPKTEMKYWANSLLLYYWTYELSRYHPLSSFQNAIEHYYFIIKQFSDLYPSEVNYSLWGCLMIMKKIVRSYEEQSPLDKMDMLVEAYKELSSSHTGFNYSNAVFEGSMIELYLSKLFHFGKKVLFLFGALGKSVFYELRHRFKKDY